MKNGEKKYNSWSFVSIQISHNFIQKSYTMTKNYENNRKVDANSWINLLNFGQTT